MHNGRSCDLCIFGIPEVNFQGIAFKFGILRTLRWGGGGGGGIEYELQGFLNPYTCIFHPFFLRIC